MLTEEQQECVQAAEPCVGVMAGAGTGKTTVMIARICHLLARGVKPSSIAVFTFTRAAAGELRQRLGESASGMYVGTFHSIALECLPNSPQVLDEQEARSLSDLAAGMASAKGSLASWYKIIANRDNIHGDSPSPVGSQTVLSTYRSLIDLNGALDYRGLLLALHSRIVAGESLADCHYVMVDEAQDTDSLQWQIIDALVDRGAELFAVGDIKQSIYGWRGARYQDFLDRCPTIYHITESFRNPPDVLHVANCIIEAAGMECPPLRSSKDNAGLSITADPVSISVRKLIDEELFAAGDIAVLCRSNHMVSLVQEELRSDGIACSDLCGQRDILESLRPLLNLIVYPSTMNRSALLANWPICEPLLEDRSSDPLPLFLSRLPDLSAVELDLAVTLWRDGLCVKPTVRAILTALSRALKNEAVELWNNSYGDWDPREALQDLATSAITPTRREGVTVCTTHQAKGLEFPATVAVCEFSSKLEPEAYRVFYVALTRCQERCVVTDSGRTPTEFMKIIRQEVLRARLNSSL